MNTSKPRVNVSTEGAITVAELVDEDVLEEHVIEQIAEELFALTDKAPLRLVVTFGRVKHLSSSALGTLIRLNKRIEQDDGHLKLADIHRSLYEIFAITKLDKLFDICDTKEAACSSFTS